MTCGPQFDGLGASARPQAERSRLLDHCTTRKLPVVTYPGPTDALVVTYADARRDPWSSCCKWTAPHAASPDKQSDTPCDSTILQVVTNTAAASLDPQDPIASEVPEHLQELFQSTVQDNNLSSPLASELKDLFVEHKDTFATGPTDIGYCDLLQHDIDTGDQFPIKQSPRRPPLSARQAEDDILDEMLESGVIEPSDSPWASPVCLVKKKDGPTVSVLTTDG